MLDNSSMSSILRQLILDQLARVSPFPAYRASRSKKTSGKRSKYRGTLPHQGAREIARRKRQLDAGSSTSQPPASRTSTAERTTILSSRAFRTEFRSPHSPRELGSPFPALLA